MFNERQPNYWEAVEIPELIHQGFVGKKEISKEVKYNLYLIMNELIPYAVDKHIDIEYL